MFIIVTIAANQPMLLNMEYISAITRDGTSLKFTIGTEERIGVRFANENFAKDAFEMIVHAADRGGERVVIDLTGHQ